MENQTNFNNPSGNIENKPKKRRAKWIIIVLIIILVALFLILGGYNNIKMTFKGLWAVNQFNKGMELYEKTMTEDIYGGKTPEETLAMFIEALEKNDIELAGKYFALDDNLSRKELTNGLNQAIELGRLQEILKFLKSVEKSPRDFVGMNSYELVTWNADKTLVDHVVRFDLNTYSKVWKISSF